MGAIGAAEVAQGADPARAVSLVKMPYRGERNLPDISDSPDYLEQGGILALLEQQGCRLKKPISNVALTPEELKAYGEWNRLGLANEHLARIVAADRKEGNLPVGLLANCSALMGNCKCAVARGPASTVRLMIGDGRSDFCIASSAHFVLAKSKLLEHCRDNDLPHMGFKSIADANRIIAQWFAQQRQPQIYPPVSEGVGVKR